MQGFEDLQKYSDNLQKYGKDNMQATMKTIGAFSQGCQAIAVESAEFVKKSFEQGSATFEKLLGAKSVDKAIEIQNAYWKSAYENFASEANRMGELYAALARESWQPFEAFAARARGGK